MSIGLKTILPLLSPILGHSPAGLYERQRSLVRLGAIPEGAGRGPGSGVRATPDTVAMLIVSVMITDSLSDVDGRVLELATCPYAGSKGKKSVCELTGAETFAGSIAAALADPEVGGRVYSVEVGRQSRSGTLYFNPRGRGRFGRSSFTRMRQQAGIRPDCALTVDAQLGAFRNASNEQKNPFLVIGDILASAEDSK